MIRIIAPNRSRIARGLGTQLVDGRIRPALDDHMGDVFEDMAREHARALAAVGELDADRVESWWSADGAHEIDLVGVTGRDAIGFVGTAKWSARPLGRDVLKNLDDHAAALPGVQPGIPRLIYGRASGSRAISAEPGVRCFSAADMYA